MSSFLKLPIVFPPTVPLAPSPTRDIGRHPDVAGWWVADAGRVVADGGGKVSAWIDRSNKGRNLAQATSGAQATFAASQINSRGAMQFRSTNFYNIASGVPVNADFSVVVTFNAASGSSGRYLLKSGNGTGYWLELLITGDNRIAARIWDGTAPNRAQAITDPDFVSAAVWTVAMVTWDAAGKVIRLSTDGGATWLAGGNATATGSSQATMRIGADLDGDEGANASIAEVMLLSKDMSKATNAQLRAAILEYVGFRYGLLVS